LSEFGAPLTRRSEDRDRAPQRQLQIGQTIHFNQFSEPGEAGTGLLRELKARESDRKTRGQSPES